MNLTETAPGISMADARQMIISCYKHNKPLMLLGRPGMGKTSLFEEVCRHLKIGFIDFRLTMRDPVDVGGMRVPDLKSGLMKHYIPEDLPDTMRHGPKGIILFDEINVVGQLMQATAYGLIQERRNGSYRMPEGWVPMASGNNLADRAAAQRLSNALANRFNIQIVQPDLDSWLAQYGSEHVDTRGCAFLRFRRDFFHIMPGEPIKLLGDQEPKVLIPTEDNRFPSARSWTNAFSFIEEEPPFRRKLFTGYVGPTAADEFEAFWRILENAPSIAEIIEDPTGARLPAEHDAGTQYAVAGMLARTMDRKNIAPLMKYADRMLPDYQVALVTDAMRREPGLRNTAAYGSWAIRHQNVTL